MEWNHDRVAEKPQFTKLFNLCYETSFLHCISNCKISCHLLDESLNLQELKSLPRSYSCTKSATTASHFAPTLARHFPTKSELRLKSRLQVPDENVLQESSRERRCDSRGVGGAEGTCGRRWLQRQEEARQALGHPQGLSQGQRFVSKRQSRPPYLLNLTFLDLLPQVWRLFVTPGGGGRGRRWARGVGQRRGWDRALVPCAKDHNSSSYLRRRRRSRPWL